MKPSLNEIKKKTIFMVCIVAVLLALLVLRVAYWQIIRGDELSSKAKAQQQGSSIVTASRGDIYDRNGKVLAESATVNTLICNPKDIEADGDSEVIAARLAPVLNMDQNEILKIITKNSRYQVIKKRLTNEQTEAVKKLEIQMLTQRLQKHLKGYILKMIQRDIIRSTLHRIFWDFTGYDNNGLQGIELTFDDELMGRNGSIETNQSAKGTTLKDQQNEYLNSSQNGDDVVLTIDETIQHFLEKHLEEAVTENKLKEGAAGIIMNPKTGEILAMATKPDFDVNNPYDIDQFEKYAIDLGYDTSDDTSDDPDATPKPTEDPNNLSDEAIAKIRNKMWRNKVISDTYEPGSTFKIITAAAALEEHVVDLNSTFYCPGFKIVADRKIGCANKSGHGAQTFVEGVRNSCNPVFMELGERLGYEKFMEYFTAFGLTEKTNVELVGEASSIYYHNKMSEVDIATSSFGQGFQITPIQLVTAVSAVINGGERMKPQIVKEIRNSNGILKTYEPEVISRVISEETSQQMREILESVVSLPTSTGKNAYVKGCRIGGKTGTSEKGNRDEEKRIASFIGFAPANDPEIVCLIMLDEPQVDNKYGGTIAAPLAGEVIEDVLNYLGVEKQYTENEEPDVKQEIPDVRTMDLTEAKKAIVDKKLNVQVRGDGDTVVDQLPKPGTMLNEDSTVILYTEEIDKTHTVTVPNLKGMSVDNAKYTLEMSGLNFEIVGAGHSEVSSAYAVNQSIAAGEEVTPATVIGVEFRQVTSD